MTIRTKNNEFLIKRNDKTHKSTQEAIMFIKFDKEILEYNKKHQFASSKVIPHYFFGIDVEIYSTLKNPMKIGIPVHFSMHQMTKYPKLSGIFWTEFDRWKRDYNLPFLYVAGS